MKVQPIDQVPLKAKTTLLNCMISIFIHLKCNDDVINWIKINQTQVVCYDFSLTGLRATPLTNLQLASSTDLSGNWDVYKNRRYWIYFLPFSFKQSFTCFLRFGCILLNTLFPLQAHCKADALLLYKPEFFNKIFHSFPWDTYLFIVLRYL